MPDLEKHCEYDLVVGDGLVTREPTMLWGAIMYAPTAGDTAVVYDGRDTTSGRKIMTLQIPVAGQPIAPFTIPVYCPGGIYVDGSDSQVETTIFHRTVR